MRLAADGLTKYVSRWVGWRARGGVAAGCDAVNRYAEGRVPCGSLPSGAVCAGLVLNRERLVGWDILHGVVGESGSATNHQVRVDHLHEVHRGLHVLEAGDGDGAVAGAENEVDLVHGDVPVVVGADAYLWQGYVGGECPAAVCGPSRGDSCGWRRSRGRRCN